MRATAPPGVHVGRNRQVITVFSFVQRAPCAWETCTGSTHPTCPCTCRKPHGLCTEIVGSDWPVLMKTLLLRRIYPCHCSAASRVRAQQDEALQAGERHSRGALCSPDHSCFGIPCHITHGCVPIQGEASSGQGVLQHRPVIWEFLLVASCHCAHVCRSCRRSMPRQTSVRGLVL